MMDDNAIMSTPVQQEQDEPLTLQKKLNSNNNTASSNNNNNNNNSNANIGKKINYCEFCKQTFSSRNAIFKHLRDPTTTCGHTIQQSNELLEKPPSIIKKENRKMEYRIRRMNQKTNNNEKLKQIYETKQCLWIGNIPLLWTRYGGKYRRLRELLRIHITIPLKIPQPYIKFVKRKAYRKNHNNNIYLGYAIIVLRDEKECQIVQNYLNNKMISIQNVFGNNTYNNKDYENLIKSNISPFHIKVRPANDDTTNNTNNKQQNDNDDDNVTMEYHNNNNNKDPSLEEQLQPLSTQELLHRIHNKQNQNNNNNNNNSNTKNDNDDKSDDNGDKHESILQQAILLYTKYPKSYMYHVGRRCIPDTIRDELLNILQTLRWPVLHHRPTMDCEKYLVLPSNVIDNTYNELRTVCHKLITWTDTNYQYSGIAVTKNFISSPHIDHNDQTYQYAVSLGTFKTDDDHSGIGGELCIDGYDINNNEVIHVVNTYNCIVRVDGRYVHWVRTYNNSGDRYSIIFYNTKKESYTPILPMGIDPDFVYSINNNNE